jgi:FG-GAP-like repeat
MRCEAAFCLAVFVMAGVGCGGGASQGTDSTPTPTLTPAELSFVENGQQLNQAVGQGVALGDFNVDRALDAIVVNGDDYRVYFGDGRGQFSDSGQRLTLAASGGEEPTLFDLNGDGRVEVITGTTVWLIDSQGRFTAQPLEIESTETLQLDTMQFADLNGDGQRDLFALRSYTASRVYLNDGHGRFRDTGQRLGDGTIGDGRLALVALGDIDGNGTVDAVTAGWRWNGSTPCPNHVWLNDGQGNFRDSGQLLDEGASHAHGLALGDLNGDGRADLVMAIQDAARSGRIYLNHGNGRFVGGPNLGGAGGEGVALGDFDGDGTPDVFVAQSTPPSRVWLNNGSGTLRDSGVRLGSNCFRGGAVGDFNADRKLDIFAVGAVWTGGGQTPAPARIWLNTTPSR